MKRPSRPRYLIKVLPASRGGQLKAGIGLLLALPLAGIAIIAASVWIEDHHPAGDPDRALLSGFQRVTSQPVVGFLGRQIERRIRARADLVWCGTGQTLEEALKQFLDETQDSTQRRQQAYRLALVASPECIRALQAGLASASPEDRAYMAQLIGSTGNPKAKASLLPLLEDPDENVVRAALRGLGAIGGDDVAMRLAVFLEDESQSPAVRVDAALALATTGSPAAAEALVRTLEAHPSDDLATEILHGLGTFEFPRVETTFTRLINDAELGSRLKSDAIEALSRSTPDALPFLLRHAGGHPDAEVRASAAWAAGTHGAAPDGGAALLELAATEPQTQVRRRLYEALIPQTAAAADDLLPRVQAEKDPATRIAGYNAVGAMVARDPSGEAAAEFDRRVAPELEAAATRPNSLNLQMRAVFALRRAGTPGARDALSRIANHAPPQVAAAARHGLKAARP